MDLIDGSNSFQVEWKRKTGKKSLGISLSTRGYVGLALKLHRPTILKTLEFLFEAMA